MALAFRQPTGWAKKLWLYLILAFCGMAGSLARMGLTALTSFQGQLGGGLLWANFGGSLIMGFTSRNDFLYKSMLEDERGTYQTPSEIPLFVALNTGICGSITSFSSFIELLFLLSARTDLTLDYAYKNPGYGVMMFLAYVILTMSVSVTGFNIGQHLARFSENLRPIPLLDSVIVLEVIMAFLGLAGWITSLVLFIVYDGHSWRYYAGAMLFSPLGVYARYELSLLLNKRNKNFMIGTFSANMIAVIVLAICTLLQTGNRPGQNTRLLTSPTKCLIVSAISQGFCGCLSTISTFMNELCVVLRPKSAFYYGIISILSGFSIFLLICGPYFWTHGVGPSIC